MGFACERGESIEIEPRRTGTSQRALMAGGGRQPCLELRLLGTRKGACRKAHGPFGGPCVNRVVLGRHACPLPLGSLSNPLPPSPTSAPARAQLRDASRRSFRKCSSRQRSPAAKGLETSA